MNEIFVVLTRDRLKGNRHIKHIFGLHPDLLVIIILCINLRFE